VGGCGTVLRGIRADVFVGRLKTGRIISRPLCSRVWRTRRDEIKDPGLMIPEPTRIRPPSHPVCDGRERRHKETVFLEGE